MGSAKPTALPVRGSCLARTTASPPIRPHRISHALWHHRSLSLRRGSVTPPRPIVEDRGRAIGAVVYFEIVGVAQYPSARQLP